MPQVLESLNDRQRPWAQAILRRAYQSTDVETAQRLLLDLARRREAKHPSEADSVREVAESVLSRTRHVKRNLKRWRGGQMLRWVAAGVLEAEKGFRRMKGMLLRRVDIVR